MSRIQSKGKAAKYYERIKQMRVDWANSKPAKCMACGAKNVWPPLAVHEIERRSHCDEWAHPANLLLICSECHEGPFATMSHAKQLGYKWLADRNDFDLMHWLRLRDPILRAPNRVTMEEIMDWVEVITTDEALGVTRKA